MRPILPCIGALLVLATGACEMRVGNGQPAQSPTGAVSPPPTPGTPATPATPTPATPPPENPPSTPAPTTPTAFSNAGKVGKATGAPLPTVPRVRGVGVFGSGDAQTGDLQGFVYNIPEGTTKFIDPRAANLQPLAELYTKNLNIAPRAFADGFPGVTTKSDWFEIRYEGNFVVPAAGTYVFRVLSDDGALVYIDDQKVLDDDGIHTPTEVRGTKDLTPGSHKVRVDYFNGSKNQIALQLWITPPGGREGLLQSQ